MAQADRPALARRAPESNTPPLIPLSEIALTGIYEVSKILNAPTCIEEPRAYQGQAAQRADPAVARSAHGVPRALLRAERQGPGRDRGGRLRRMRHLPDHRRA